MFRQTLIHISGASYWPLLQFSKVVINETTKLLQFEVLKILKTEKIGFMIHKVCNRKV